MESIDRQREEAVEICKEKIKGIKIVGRICFGIILIMLIINGFAMDFIVSAVVLAIIVTAVAFPFRISENRMIKTILEEDPVMSRVIRLGWERVGKKSYPVAYFLFRGEEKYAVNYNNKEGREVREGDSICVWTNGKDYIMVKRNDIAAW